MDDLAKILARCKCSVSLSVNSHRDYHEPAAEYLDDLKKGDNCDASDDVLAEMIARDTIVELQFYPDSSVGFYKVCHYDVAAALRAGVEILESE